jgi:hypothetical protein
MTASRLAGANHHARSPRLFPTVNATITPVNMTVGQNVRVQGIVWQPGATLGATGANNLPGIRTNMNSGRGRARGHGLI